MAIVARFVHLILAAEIAEREIHDDMESPVFLDLLGA